MVKNIQFLNIFISIFLHCVLQTLDEVSYVEIIKVESIIEVIIPRQENEDKCWYIRSYPFLTSVIDVVQPKTSPFSTRHLILVKYNFLSQLYQPISLLFSYLNSERHNLVIELCREQK